jgi:hypothetical protein
VAAVAVAAVAAAAVAAAAVAAAVAAVAVAAVAAVKVGLQTAPKTKVVQIPVLIPDIVTQPMING